MARGSRERRGRKGRQVYTYIRIQYFKKAAQEKVSSRENSCVHPGERIPGRGQQHVPRPGGRNVGGAAQNSAASPLLTAQLPFGAVGCSWLC